MMSRVRTLRYSDPATFVLGLADLRRDNVTPRKLLFLALDPSGAVHVTLPEEAAKVTHIKVGDKLGLPPPPGRFYYFDSIHRLRDGCYLYNGDRRLKDPGDAVEIAGLVCDFLRLSQARNVFFGCTPHQPGSWLVVGSATRALHEAGFVEVVPVGGRLLARRIMDHRLWQLEVAGDRLDDWEPVFDSPLGNLIMLERRVIADRLVLTCEQGLVEVDVGHLPAVRERDRVELAMGFAVVGRVENQAFAVTSGKREPWGLDEVRPAVLIGATGGSLVALGQALAEAAKHRDYPVDEADDLDTGRVERKPTPEPAKE